MANEQKKAAPTEEAELEGDYRKLLNRTHLGRWDLQKPDGTFVDAVVQIDSVKRYKPPAWLLAKKMKEAQKSGKPMRSELLIGFAGKKKKWIAGPDSQKSIAAATLIDDVGKWRGQKIKLHFAPEIMLGGKRVGGLRAAPAGNAPVTTESLDNAVDEEMEALLEAAAKAAEGEDVFDDGEPVT
jgi:hypothetical protein